MFVTYPPLCFLSRSSRYQPAGSALAQAGGVNEGQSARGARNPHALAPREGQAVGLHAIAEQHEGFGGHDEAKVFALIQDALGVLDAGEG